MDPAKLKVVELREELQARGLNTKGVKADLVKRLKEALEKETETSIPDTSILETSTEEMDTSQNQESAEAEDPLAVEENSPQKESPVKSSPKKTEPNQESKSEDAVKPEENAGENGADEYEQNDVGSEGDDHNENGEAKAAEGETAEGESTGEKRKRESDQDTEENAHKKRERSPIREDEPELDYSKTLLSWFDSDLLLQFDRDNFLSAKPISDGAMGYIWNSVRATHGISSGKVCYEVKLTEALKWEDLTAQFTLPERPDWYQKRLREEKKKEEEKKQEDKEKIDGEEAKVKEENTEGEKEKEEKKETTDEKMETEVKTEKSEEKEENSEAKTEESQEKHEEKMDETQEEEKKEEPPREPIPTHLFRAGFSLGGTNLQLGENKYSYGYENTGKFVNDKNFTDYGVMFGEGDVIGAFLSIDSEQVTITYTVNGAVQPVATTIPRSELPEQNFVLYPHVSSKNFAFEVNFGDREEPWFAIPEELTSHSFLSKVEDKVAGPVRPETRKDCEVYLMIGLPASGKSRWVSEHIKNNPDKQYTVIGNHSLLEKMTVDGQSIRQRFGGSWKILNDRLQKCLNRLTDVAAVRRRHFIIDQTNLFQAAQRRKMRAFEGYQRKAVVVVPDEEEQNRRLKLQVEQDGKSIPEQTVWELKAGMEIPEKVDWLEETIWPELDEEKAKEVVKKYNEEAKSKGYTKRFPRRQNQRWNNGRDRYGGNRYGDWGSWGRQGGGWDRRDRGPPRQGGWKDYGDRNPRGGYGGGNRRGGGGGWGQQGWGGGRQGGGWNQQMYSGYNKWNQEGWGGYGQGWGQGGWGNQGGGQGGQGGNRQNWNYYGQYGNQGSGWQQQGGKQQQGGYDYSAD